MMRWETLTSVVHEYELARSGKKPLKMPRSFTMCSTGLGERLLTPEQKEAGKQWAWGDRAPLEVSP